MSSYSRRLYRSAAELAVFWNEGGLCRRALRDTGQEEEARSVIDGATRQPEESLQSVRSPSVESIVRTGRSFASERYRGIAGSSRGGLENASWTGLIQNEHVIETRAAGASLASLKCLY